MTCPVCGFEDGERVCARCGTDLDALKGTDGEPHLEIRPTHKRAPHLGASRAT